MLQKWAELSAGGDGVTEAISSLWLNIIISKNMQEFYYVSIKFVCAALAHKME
jgi:hypothetical protein